jgi:sRNA-binding carbon storage regulator CsrA
MPVFKRRKQESVIVAGSDGSEQVLKVTVIGIEDDTVSLKFDVAAGVMVHSGEEWESVQSAKQAAKANQGADRPKHRAAYSD